MLKYRLIKNILFCLPLFLSHFSFGSKLTFERKLVAAIERSGIPSRQLSVIVADSKQIFYQLNENNLFIPASLMKIFTTSALLDSLPPSLKFKTAFMSKSKVVGSVLNGNLYLRGGGDPAFVSESLWNLVNHLKRTGVKKIKGNLILDARRFDLQRRGTRLEKSSHASYDAPVGSLSFNWNTANIYVRPGKKVNDPVKVILDPSGSYFSSFKNRAKTKVGAKKQNLQVRRKKTRYQRESLIITGALDPKHREVLLYKNILYPSQWTGWNALDFLKQRGITLDGKIKIGTVPRGAQVLAEWESRPLTELLQLMMKYSNNFMVEMLVKNMVVELTGRTGNLKDGIQLIKKYLQKKHGISEKDYQLIQASGLSRKNRIKASQLLQILRYWTSHPLQAEFESALALAGEDGTLKKMFFNSNLHANMHAKTGTLNGVTGLAGYLRTKEQKKKLFVLIFNGSLSSQKKVDKLFQKLVYMIWKN